MNKQCFRVIFSKTLQRLVVVSELAKSEGKSTERNDFSISHVVAQLKPLTFSLFCALGFVAFSDSALAETLIIQADKSAPKNQQPIVLQTANGLPQVNIQTPNDKGLSHNKYSQFDVAEKGAILNNSRTNTQTQQAGMVQGNPYLARGEAKVILNEVNSNKPSVMKGYVEVAGKKADVIIANPSGLHCEGCGIINSDRATFTTGKPEIKNGQVDNFKVEAGKVKVSGKGLDNSRVDYTEIIARETEVNAGIWSKKETKVITGKNTVKRSETDKNLQIIHTNQPLAGEVKPQVAIDVGELGGMYSGKIHLIGTENGVGVRNAGHIGASAETLQIDSQGRIVNTGTLNAAQSVTLTASQGIENKGKIENRQGDIRLNSAAGIKQDGSLVARHGNIHKTASSQITQNGESVAKGSITYQAPKVTASTQSLIAAGVEVKDTAQGEVHSLETHSAQGKDITVSATTKTTLQGKNLASGKINVQGSEIDLDNSQAYAYSVNVSAHQGHIQANNATLIADKTLSLSTPTELQTQQSYLKAEKITSHQGSLNTQNAVWEQTGTDELKLSVNEQLKNQGGTFKTQGDLTIRSQGVDNRQGQLISGRKLVIEAGLGKVDSSQGKIRSTATLTINSGELDNSQGAIQSEDDIRINTHGQALINHNTLSNETGIVTLGKLDLNTGKLENQHGYLASRSSQTLLATELNNHKGLIKSLNTLEITTPIIQNNGGIISAQSKANITATDINQIAGQLGADTLSINATRLNSEQHSLIAAGTANIQIADTFSNQQSRLNTLGDLTIQSQGLNNLLGAIQSIRGNTSIDTQQAINNTQGNITSHVQLNLNTRHLENQQGTISAQSSEISVGSLINRLGALQSTEQLSLNAEQVENSNGTIYGGKSLTLSASDSITQRAGKIGASVLEINTGMLQSTANSVIAADNATFNVKNTLTNTESEISATEHLTIHSKAINNQDGLLLTEKGNLTMNSQAQQINNERGKIVSGEVLNINSGAFNNQQGLVQAHHTALLNTNHNNLQNNKGVITSGADLQLNTSSIDNDNGTISAHAIDAKFTELEQQQGKIIASEALNLNANGNIRSTQQSLLQAKNLTMTVSGQVDNQQSEIVAHNSATIHSHELNNRNGVIIAEEGHLDINAQTQAVTNEQGKISAGSTLTLNSGELNNLRGLIQSRQGMQINTHQGNLNNQQTQKTDAEESQQLGIISLGQLEVTTQQFLNQQGYVLSQQNQTINAQKIENEAGTISSLANQTLSVNQSLHNNNGRVSGQQTQIISAALENQAGVIQGSDLLDVQVSGNINNQFGQLKTDKQLDVTATSVNNREGQIRAIDGTLSLTSTEAIDNTQGYITAAQSSTIHTKDLNNQQGVVYNKQDTLTLNLQQGLDNQQGQVISQDNLALKSHTLTNHQGTLYAKNSADIQATSQIDNQQGGKIHGLGDIHLQTNELDNRGGEIRTQHSLALNVISEINNQKVNETGSLIESGNVLNISTAHLNNSHTTSSAEKMTQGILATTLTVTAQMLNNHQGKIHSRAQSELNVSKQIDNRQGGITGDDAVHIEGKALRLDNQQGQLQAGGKLSISANEITTDGHIEGRDIEVTQQQDFITGNAIHANNTLSIKTVGNFVNQHQLYADNSVTLNANHITNQLNSRISSANTQLTAKGDVHNEGLINSISPLDNAGTIIKAGGRIVNTGEGRIYGDHIALQADRIENSDKDYGSGNIKSAVVASRGDLDIAAREIENNTAHYLADNQVGSTLFSIGNMHFGRTLNTDNQAEGKADALRNNSSVIEAEGNIELNINQIQNNNTHFEVEHVKTGQAPTETTRIPGPEGDQTINETYIVPMGRNERGNLKTDFTNELNGDKSSINENDPHIPMKLLRWAGWSRAGQLVYKNDGAEPAVLKAGDVITPDTPLAIRNEVNCDYINGKESCTYTPAGQYGADSPIWAYFGATPPSTPQPKFPFDDLTEQPWFVESEWFDEDGTFKRPSRPFRFLGSERYRAQKVKWDYYVEHIKPLEDWERDNADSINKVDAGIEKHNRNRLGDLADKYYRDFWRLHINNHRVDESNVTRTVSGQILAGGNIDFDSRSFTNDKSIVIAGQNIALKDQIHNIDEEGLHRITDTGDKVFTFDKWRGGFKRYFQRKWENHGPYTRIIETPFDMKLFRVDEKANYDDKKVTSNSHKEETTHNLSLSSLNIQDNQFSAQGDQNLGSLNGDDNAQFIGLNTSDKTQLEHWQGKGQTVSSQGVTNNFTPVRQLSRIELGNETEIRSIQPDLAIPQNVLYRVNTNPNSQVLIETDPDFTNQKRWLSSDYMFNALRYEPNQMQKRLGDGFYEQRLIREQINRLTGRQFVGNYTDFDTQYRGLMDAGVTFAQKFNLRPGIALNPHQVAQLTTDIVWFENHSVQLPNGKVETVLVPKVYAMAKKGDITGNGTLLSGNKVTHKGGEFVNNGTVAGRELVRFDSDSIRNSGTIQAGTITGNISGNVENIGGTLEADRTILLNVAGNFTHRSTTHTTQVNESGYSRLDTTLGRKGLLHVKGKEGELHINANNIDISGADIINDGQGSTYLSAKNQLNLTALQVGFDEKMGGGNHYRNESVDDVVISNIQGNGNVTLAAKNIYSEGADLAAKEKLIALAENEMVLGTAERTTSYEEYHKYKRRNVVSSSTKEQYGSEHTKEHKGTVLAASDIVLDGNTVSLIATQAAALNNMTVTAQENLLLDAAVNEYDNTEWTKEKKRGITASTSNGVASVGVGSSKAGRTETHSGQSLQLTHLNALGNLTIVSQNGNLTANAAQLQSGGDMHLQGNQVSLNALTENEQTHLHQYHRRSGMGISAVYNPVKVFKDNFGQQAEQGSATGIIGKIFTAVDAVAKTGNQVTNLGGAYTNTHRSSLDKNRYQERAVVTTANAGGDLSIVATTGSLTSQGSQLSAKGDGYLSAKADLLLDVATSTSGQNAQEKRKGAELSIAKVSVGAYADKNLGEGESQTEQATVLSFGGNATLTAQEGNLTLAGTQAVAEGTVNLNAGKDILLTTATTRTAMGESQTGHAWGDVVVSETERFNGYNRKLDSQNNEQVSHQQALVASLNESVNINAGKDFHSTSGQILAKNRIDVSAEKVTFDTIHNTGNSQSHSSDLKIGQFSRVSSPIIDLIQSVEQAVNNKEASDRVRLAQALGTAAKAYSTAGDLANGGALFRVETGTGFSHSRERNETASRESVGNQLNAQHINITSRSGDITATHTAFTSRDEQGKRLNDSSITFNSAKDLNLNAGQSEYRMKGRQQNSGFEAGTGVAVGAQTGWYVYAQAGFSNGKQDEYHLTHQNSQIDTETLNINTQGNTTLQGAVAKANRINADIKGNLTIESLQDIHQSESDSAGFGGRIQAAIGTAWGGSAYGNMASGESNSKQVAEQSGLFAETGGYNVTANNVELIGGAIASQNPENSTLTTNTITFTDIQNESSSQAVSAGISASANLNKQAGTEAKTEAEAKHQAEIAKLTGTPQSNGINPSVPMFDSSQDSSTTKATLTEGTIILNKDSTPTQTTAKELGINTELSQANRQVEQPKDINQVLKEQQILSQAAGNVAGAVMTYVDNQKAELEKAKEKAKEEAKAAEQAGDLTTAERKHYEAQMLDRETARWESGGDKKQGATAIASALSLAIAGKPAEAIVAGVASPYINEIIKDITDNENLKALNIPLHILWGAVEAELAGGSAKVGAIAAGVGEVGATVLAQSVYGKAASDLTTEEKANLLASAKLLAGVASGAVSTGNGAETLANASVGMTVAENAVESNYLSDWQKAQQAKELKECNGNGYCEFKINAYWTAVDLGQDTSFVSGLAAGVPVAIVEGVSDAINMALSPIETLEAIKVMITQDDAFNKWAEATKQSYVERIEKLQSEYEKAGASGSFNAGLETGRLLTDIAGIVAGGAGVAKVGVSAVNKGIKSAAKNVKALNIDRPKFATCSFHGDMEVKTDKGYRPISSIKVGDKVLAKNEITGITTYQKVQAHYSNPYDYTVYVEIKDSKGKYQTIVSNKIHPFFAQVLSGIAPISSEGHHYKGEIAKAQWVDAKYLQKGYRLLSANGEWQTVSNVTQKAEALKAYNMTVDKDHTYFIKGAQAENEGVWVHNDCWHALPNGAKQVASIDGYKAYQFTDPKDGKVVTVVQKDLNRFETPSHQHGVDPHFNRLSQQIDAETGRYLSTDNPVDGLYNRAYLRSETLQKIYANYEKLPNGDYRNKLTRQEIKGPIDIGHIYGWEHRRLSLAAKELNWSQKQFNDYVNARPENFRLENMSENRSHKNEMPGKHDIQRIKSDMEKFLKEGK